MKFNPEIHHRRSVRLKGYDYSQAGLYYITICCAHHICHFGNIEIYSVGAGLVPAQRLVPAQNMILNEFGQIAYDEWLKLPNRFSNFELDVFQIMPNHIHAIIQLNDYGVADINRAGTSPAPTVGTIVGAYKSIVYNTCIKIFKNRNEIMERLWQRNYYENIIRNDISLQNITDYIINNPANWQKDEFNNEN